MIAAWVDMISCFVSAAICAWIIRQTLHAHSREAFAFRICLASVSMAMLLKGFERLEGDPPTLTDVFRDVSWMALLVCVIWFHRNRFGHI